MRQRGFVHICCGTGRGKTTAALGLGMRAAGHGYPVVMVQFLKTAPTGELAFLEGQAQFQVLRFEHPHGFIKNLSEEQLRTLMADMQEALYRVRILIREEACYLLILDEILDAVEKGLIRETEVEELVDSIPESMELVLTGHTAPASLIEKADYVTEMKKIKHPYDQGVRARQGIEY